MKRFAVMGFTEAELGFVMAALFAAIAFTTVVDRDAHAVKAAEVDRLRAELAQRSAELASVRAELEKLRAELSALTGKLSNPDSSSKRSTKVPNCWEKGEPREPVARVLVRDRNLYELNGELLTLDDVRRRLSDHIDRSDALRCRYTVRAAPSETVNAVDQSFAVWQLRRFFDVDDRPR